MYIKFIENNEWEGETWNFYIPLHENIESIKKLINFIKEDESFSLSMKIYLDDEVDLKTANKKCSGYLPKHNKLVGKLILPEDTMSNNLLYKGWEQLSRNLGKSTETSRKILPKIQISV